MSLRLVIFAIAAFILFSDGVSAKIAFPNFDESARAYTDRLKTRAAGRKENVNELIANAKSAAVTLQWPVAIARYEAALGLAQAQPAWLELARAWHSFKPQASEGTWAAYNAYTLAQSKPQETEALQLLADFIYEQYARSSHELQDLQNNLKNGDFSNGLGATMDDYRRVGSETLKWLALSNRAYSELRVLVVKKNDVIEERATEQAPQIFMPLAKFAKVSDRYAAYCVRFSLPLKSDAEAYRPFISLTKNAPQDSTADAPETADARGGTTSQSTPAAFEPKASNRTLCLYGLEHGQNYTLKLAAKFSSSDSHELGAPVTVGFFVADRKEQARFRSSAFVLPKYSDGSIPIRTINATSVTITSHPRHRPQSYPGNRGQQVRRQDWIEARRSRFNIERAHMGGPGGHTRSKA